MAIKRGGGMMAQGHGTTSAPRQMLPPQETGGKDERTGGWSKTPTSSQQPEDGTKAGIHKRMQPCKSKDYGTTKHAIFLPQRGRATTGAESSGSSTGAKYSNQISSLEQCRTTTSHGGCKYSPKPLAGDDRSHRDSSADSSAAIPG